MKINHNWAAAGLFTAAQLIGKCRRSAVETAEIYGAAAYLKGVKMARGLFLYQTAVNVCAMFVVFGVILIEAGFIFWGPADPLDRIQRCFIAGAADVFAGGVFLAYLMSPGRWLDEAAKYNCLINKSKIKI